MPTYLAYFFAKLLKAKRSKKKKRFNTYFIKINNLCYWKIWNNKRRPGFFGLYRVFSHVASLFSVYSVLHLCSRVFPDKESMMAGALEIAGEIAGRSPVAVQGTKINLLYSRDHSVSEGLNYVVRICLRHE